MRTGTIVLELLALQKAAEEAYCIWGERYCEVGEGLAVRALGGSQGAWREMILHILTCRS